MPYEHSKTRHYSVVMKDGTITYKVWGGDCRSLRLSLEKEGTEPTVIMQRVRPLWVREGYEV